MDTIQLADGRVIDLTGKEVGLAKAAPRPLEKITTNRVAADLPLPAKQMLPLAVVAAYHIWGLRPGDIAEQLGTEPDRVETILNDDVFKNFLQQLIRSVLDSELDDLRDQIAAKARAAIEKVTELLEEDGDPKTVLNAAKDILDRAQLRPVDVVEHRHKMEGSLKIVYEKRGARDTPLTDVTFEEVDGVE